MTCLSLQQNDFIRVRGPNGEKFVQIEYGYCLSTLNYDRMTQILKHEFHGYILVNLLSNLLFPFLSFYLLHPKWEIFPTIFCFTICKKCTIRQQHFLLYILGELIRCSIHIYYKTQK